MELSKFVKDLPLDLNVLDHDPELQLLKLYAYNAYYGADEIHTEDVNDRCTYLRKNGQGIDGIFLNETQEENTIELLFSYFVGEGKFAIATAMNALSYLSVILEDVNNGLYVSGNKTAENLLKADLSDSESKVVILKVITDYTPDATEKYKLQKLIANYNVSAKGLNVSCVIVFGDDIEAEVDSNIAPYDWVNFDKLILDKNDNYLRYGDNSIVCNISALSLKKLWKKEGKKGLLAMNLRYYIKSKNIDSNIEDSITYDYDEFWYLNNGIIIVCNDYKIVDNELRLTEFSIVNGGQTSRMIGEIPFENDFFVCCKVIKNTFEDAGTKNLFISKVAEATNTQKPIKSKDIIANRIEQRNLKTLMSENKIFIEIKRGEKFDHAKYPEPWQRTKNNELAQDLYSFVYMEPGPSRNNVSTILSNNDKYKKIFTNNSYEFAFLRDVLILEKAYREYSKRISKDPDVDNNKKGLVKNGMYYCLATIGYLLKMLYNPEFKNNMVKYRNTQSLYELYSSVLAFNRGFFDTNTAYKLRSIFLFDLFDYVFSNFILAEFIMARESNPVLAYSNWTKTNVGFNLIRQRINSQIFDLKDESVLKYVSKFVVKPTQEEINKDIDSYVDKVKENTKKLESKTSDGHTMSADDTQLRNKLMEYRLKYSLDHHISENKVFTDKQMEKIVREKPLTKRDLSKCISVSSLYYIGDDIIKIISETI